MKILVATSWGSACGIANHSQMAIDAIRQADPSLEFEPRAEALDPDWVLTAPRPSVLWLNYHRGLHSRWTSERVRWFQRACDLKVVITFHDTYGERPPDDLTQQLHDLADAFVVHEPCEGLPKQILIRQGVPAAQSPYQYGPHKQYGAQPILGTGGFAFPWKGFNELADVTAQCGWAYLVCSNNATEADEARWKASNPATLVIRGFLSTEALVSHLTGCDATAFCYACANSGTSGAIRLGLAARKPLIAFAGCRQFRDLSRFDWYDPPPLPLDDRIRWCYGFDSLPQVLEQIPLQRVDPGIVAIAERDSWVRQGQKYAVIFQGLA